MENKPTFLPQGVFGEQDLTIQRLTPVRAEGAISRSLVRASQQRTLVYPFLYHCSDLSPDVEPLAECFQLTGLPTRFEYIHLPKLVFQLGPKYLAAGVPGDMVFSIPRGEADRVFAHIVSALAFDPSNKRTLGLAVQRLMVVDPFANLSRPIDDIREIMVQVYAFLPQTRTHIDLWDGSAYNYRLFRPIRKATSVDPSGQSVVGAFLGGDSNPDKGEAIE